MSTEFRSDHSRARHLRTLWKEGLWAKWASAVLALIGLATFYRDDFLSPDQQARLKGPVVAHLLSWQIWTIGVLLIVIGWLFEASFRAQRRMVVAVGEAETAQHRAEADLIRARGDLAASSARCLQLSFDNQRVVAANPGGQLRYESMITIKNRTGLPVSDCLLQIVRVDRPKHEYATQLCPPFNLLIDENVEKPFAYYVLATEDRPSNLFINTGWRKMRGNWINEGGVFAYENDNIILEVLSSSTPSVRLHLRPKIDGNHWSFDVVS